MSSEPNDSVGVKFPEAVSSGGVVGNVLAAEVRLLQPVGGAGDAGVVSRAGQVQRYLGEARPVRAPVLERLWVPKDICN